MSEIQQTVTEAPQSVTSEPQGNLGTTTAEVSPTPTQEASIGFLDSLNEELRSIPALKTFKDVDSLAKSYVHAQSLLGKKLEQMTPDELNVAFGKMNGALESPDAYQLQAEMDPDTIGFFKQLAHDLKLNPNQAAQLVAKFEEVDKQANLTRQQKEELRNIELQDILRKDWGTKIDEKINLAKKAIAELGGPDLVKELESQGLLHNPGLLKAFVKAGEGLLESNLVGPTGLGSFSMTPEQARRAKDQKMMSAEFKAAYFDEMHPAHKGAVKEMNELYAIISSGTQEHEAQGLL